MVVIDESVYALSDRSPPTYSWYSGGHRGVPIVPGIETGTNVHDVYFCGSIKKVITTCCIGRLSLTK